MNKFLGLLLVIFLFIIGLELFFLLKIKSQTKNSNNFVTIPATNTKEWEPWTISDIRTYKNKQYGTISSALVKANMVTKNNFVAELKNKSQISFQFDEGLEFFERYENQQKQVTQKSNSNGFPIEVGKIYLVEWLGQPKENNQLWRISRLVL